MNEEKLNSLTREEAIYYLDNQMDYTYQLQQENQQLKFQLEYEKENLMFSKDYAKCLEEKRDKYKSVLDEIRELVSHFSGGQLCECSKELGMQIEKILDKVK